MDFVDGQSLLSLLEKERRLSMTRACRIFLQVCDAMAHAHSFGVIHRDLKPSNIVLLTENDKSDQVRIVDFGIAKTNPIWGETDSRLTQDGQVVGSPAYMSPEQCLGDRVDHRSDIYSVGCAMYQSLSGIPPFSAANSMAILLLHINEAPPASIPIPSGSILPRLEEIVLRALAKDPDHRYQAMVDMEQELLEFMIEDLELNRL
jgi:serine/threonine-protein kinase